MLFIHVMGYFPIFLHTPGHFYKSLNVPWPGPKDLDFQVRDGTKSRGLSHGNGEFALRMRRLTMRRK